MPLRDHFHAPLNVQSSWDLVHGQWPAMIVQQLNPILPPRYVAGPHVHLGSEVEIDVATFDNASNTAPADGNGPRWLLPEPSVAVETELLNTDEYEVRVYDTERGRRLVAAAEIVSPSNKDRPESRRVFAAKCETLLRQGVSIVLVDIVTSRRFNLYVELLELIGQRDPSLGEAPAASYAAACRWTGRGRKRILETWSKTLGVGQILPTLPLWLADNFAIPLDLESSYEQTCRVLRIE